MSISIITKILQCMIRTSHPCDNITLRLVLTISCFTAEEEESSPNKDMGNKGSQPADNNASSAGKCRYSVDVFCLRCINSELYFGLAIVLYTTLCLVVYVKSCGRFVLRKLAWNLVFHTFFKPLYVRDVMVQ